MTNQTKTLHRDETGFASLVVGIILVLVLSLLTVGFAKLVRNERTQTLDKQLSTQAFYAAESGVNSVVNILDAALTAGTPIDASYTMLHTCALSGPYAGIVPQVDPVATSNVSITCLQVDTTPPTLEYGAIGGSVTSTQFTALNAVNAATAPKNISISWQCAAAGTCSFLPAAGAPALPAANTLNPNTADVLQLSLTPLDASYGRDSLVNNTYTAILYPVNSGAPGGSTTSSYTSNGASPNTQGTIVNGQCNAGSTSTFKYACNVKINLAGLTSTKYLITLRGLYSGSSKVSVSMDNGAAAPAGTLDFSGGQAMIDSTGKAQDVLKRIQVYVPISSYTYPGGAIVGDVCKRLETYPGSTTYLDETNAPLDPTSASPCNGAN